jgi:hypothetical protein
VTYFSTVFALLALVAITPASAEIMNNQAVVTLVKAGLGDELVIAKIDSESCSYDVSTNSILSLKSAGLSERVIAAMVLRCATASQVRGVTGDDSSPDPMVRHSPGIYVLEDWQHPNVLQPIRLSKSSGTRTSGNGSIVFPLKDKMVMQSASSRRPISVNNPTFYFYFNPSDLNVSDFGQERSRAAQSADEFSLVKFKQKGDTRELELGRVSFYNGSIVSSRNGMNLKNAIKFSSEDRGQGIFKVSVSPLEPGEYAFAFTGANQSARIYDFTILAAPQVQIR